MTREEAIMYWEDFLGEIDQMEVDDCWTNEDAETQREAAKMAISALRQQDVTDTNVGKKEESICGCTNLPCCHCNPGACSNRRYGHA